MTKLIVMPSKIDINDSLEYADAYLFGINNMSVNTFNIELEELKKINEIVKQNHKELFVSLNKNIYSSELEKLKQLLKEIEELNLNGIFFADTAFINLKKELNLKTPLVWSQEHLTTNYQTINNWYEFGVEYAYLSAEITLEETKEIEQNSKAKLIVPIFGYLPMFTSKRHAINNYLNEFNLKDNSKINYIEKENKRYPIVDNTDGTVVYTDNILNGYEEYLEFKNIDYVTLNNFNIDDSKFLQVLKLYKTKQGNISNLFDNLDKGFLYKETIYKVK